MVRTVNTIISVLLLFSDEGQIAVLFLWQESSFYPEKSSHHSYLLELKAILDSEMNTFAFHDPFMV